MDSGGSPEKLYLVPHAKLKSLQAKSKLNAGKSTSVPQPTLTHPETTTVHEYHQNLSRILDDNTIEPGKKAQLYQDALIKILKHKANVEAMANAPVSVKIAGSEQKQEKNEENENSSSGEPPTLSVHLPVRARKKAQNILTYIKNKGNHVRWLPSGELTINNSPVPNTNITDLLHEVTSGTRKYWTAHGIQQFMQELAR